MLDGTTQHKLAQLQIEALLTTRSGVRQYLRIKLFVNIWRKCISSLSLRRNVRIDRSFIDMEKMNGRDLLFEILLIENLDRILYLQAVRKLSKEACILYKYMKNGPTSVEFNIRFVLRMDCGCSGHACP